MKKALSLFLAVLMTVLCAAPAFALSPDELDGLYAKFLDASGPEVNGCAIDYAYYSPVKENDTVKYPLVIWLHGMGQGAAPRDQIKTNNFPYWASEELQSRFKGTGGAFLLAARSREDLGMFWTNELIIPLKAAIDGFIAAHAENIDLTRIYIGGFSMGGKMTIRMAASYPSMFAAAFPICPAEEPTAEQLKQLHSMPVWLTVSKFDVIAGYFTFSEGIWKNLKNTADDPAALRLSLMGTVKYPDGKKTASNHHAWFAVSNDMFTYDNGDYYNMRTVDGNGNEVKLTCPDGMISWISSFTSDYDGTPAEPSGAFPMTESAVKSAMSFPVRMIKAIFKIMLSLFKEPVL